MCIYIYIYTRRKDAAQAPSLLDPFGHFDVPTFDAKAQVFDPWCSILSNPLYLYLDLYILYVYIYIYYHRTAYSGSSGQAWAPPTRLVGTPLLLPLLLLLPLYVVIWWYIYMIYIYIYKKTYIFIYMYICIYTYIYIYIYLYIDNIICNN